MMKNGFVFCVVLAVFGAIALSGCSTAPKKYQEEMQGIKSQVDSLQSRVEGIEMKQVESERVQFAEGPTASEGTASTNIEIKPRHEKSGERVKEIQAALKSAGFYSGKIDGIKGKATRRAIREFQKANGLTADGVVGKKTWELLSRYSQGSGRSEEATK